jgi:thiol-disulfide isomerase/thioredoxin
MGAIRSMRRAGAAVALAMWAVGAFCGEVPFNQARFDAALARGTPVIVHFGADWCPTCKAQKPVVQELLRQPKLQSVTLFEANYDTETALKKRLSVTQQSTFVVFKAGREVVRSTGQTQPPVLQALFDKAL